MSTYPDEVKDYVNEYNSGVDNRDINLVGTAINSMVTLVFNPDDEEKRLGSIHALDQIGQVQPGFLKSAVKTLIIRYQGTDDVKKALASAALDAIFIGKKAERLIEDSAVLEELKQKRAAIENQKAEAQAKDAQVLQEIKQTQLDLGIAATIPELRTIGQYYNTCLLNNNEEEAAKTAMGLLNQLIEWYKTQRNNFIPGVLLLGQMGNPTNRKPFFTQIVTELMKLYFQGIKDQKPAAIEITDNIFKDIADLIPSDLAPTVKAEVTRRQTERLDNLNKERQKQAQIVKIKIPISPGWDPSIQQLAADYNKAIIDNNEKTIKMIKAGIVKGLNPSDFRIKKSTTEMIGILISKNPEFIEEIVKGLIPKYKDANYSEILGNFIDDLEKLKWADPQVITELQEAKKQRLIEEEARKKVRQEEYDKLQLITVKFEGDWQKEVTKFMEDLNNSLIKADKKTTTKLIMIELKKLMFVKDDVIRHESQTAFCRIAQKFPDLIEPLIEELVPLYLSTHEQRNFAVDPFGMLYDLGLAEKLFRPKHPDILETLGTEWANRKQELENLELQTKWDAIKADVTQLKINDNWSKQMQIIARDYNTGIKDKKMELVLSCVKKVVDIVMNERKDELQIEATQVLGLIAKKNIELIQPTINLFLELLEGKDTDKKTRAIKGLGEVTRQRPGWAYFGMEKLINIMNNDRDEDFRVKAAQEIERIANKDPVMMIEHIESILKALTKDPNKHVRRLAAMTLGNMAEVIPLEAQDAIPALTEALHDEFILVKKFADKALTAIREAVRKSENQ
jgi:hypothetical protein